MLEAGMAAELVLDAALAKSDADALRFWRLREEISDAQTRHGGSVRCDVSVPLSAIAEFIAQATARVLALAPATRMVVYGHMGDGNVHFNPLRPADVAAADYMAAHGQAIADAVDEVAHGFAGSISAEHGVGVARRDALPRFKSAVEMDLMARIKRAIDPGNLLNPGKLLALPAATPRP